MRFELAAVEQQQHVVRVVHLLWTAPAVAVVPLAHLLAVQSAKLRGEHRIQIRFRVSADRRVAPVQRDVGEIVQVREDAHLGELAHASDEREPHVGVTRLDHAIQAAQVVAVGARHLRHLQRIQDRLVILVHQHRDRLPRLPVQFLQQTAQAARCADPAGRNAHLVLDTLQLEHHVLVQIRGLLEAAAGEVQPHHRMADGPIPGVVDVQSGQQRDGIRCVPRCCQASATPAPRRASGSRCTTPYETAAFNTT